MATPSRGMARATPSNAMVSSEVRLARSMPSRSLMRLQIGSSVTSTPSRSLTSWQLIGSAVLRSVTTSAPISTPRAPTGSVA
jgi:hypothetical protein